MNKYQALERAAQDSDARKIKRLESIINWIAHHPLNNIVGDCIGGGWSCDTYPDDHGNRQESHANDHIEAIEKAMNGETE
jgi:hypothetical protein